MPCIVHYVLFYILAVVELTRFRVSYFLSVKRLHEILRRSILWGVISVKMCGVVRIAA